MRVPRTLRARRSAKPQPEPKTEQKPQGYRYEQTDGWASTERAERRYYESERTGFYNPIVMGFRPNEERQR